MTACRVVRIAINDARVGAGKPEASPSFSFWMRCLAALWLIGGFRRCGGFWGARQIASPMLCHPTGPDGMVRRVYSARSLSSLSAASSVPKLLLGQSDPSSATRHGSLGLARSARILARSARLDVGAGRWRSGFGCFGFLDMVHPFGAFTARLARPRSLVQNGTLSFGSLRALLASPLLIGVRRCFPALDGFAGGDAFAREGVGGVLGRRFVGRLHAKGRQGRAAEAVGDVREVVVSRLGAPLSATRRSGRGAAGAALISGGALGIRYRQRDRCCACGLPGTAVFALLGREDLRSGTVLALGVELACGAVALGVSLLTCARKDGSHQVLRIGSLEELGQPVQVGPEALDDKVRRLLCCFQWTRAAALFWILGDRDSSGLGLDAFGFGRFRGVFIDLGWPGRSGTCRCSYFPCASRTRAEMAEGSKRSPAAARAKTSSRTAMGVDGAASRWTMVRGTCDALSLFSPNTSAARM